MSVTKGIKFIDTQSLPIFYLTVFFSLFCSLQWITIDSQYQTVEHILLCKSPIVAYEERKKIFCLECDVCKQGNKIKRFKQQNPKKRYNVF